MSPGDRSAPVKDDAYWARLHVAGDKSPAVNVPTPKHRKIMGEGMRRERGGLRRLNPWA